MFWFRPGRGASESDEDKKENSGFPSGEEDEFLTEDDVPDGESSPDEENEAPQDEEEDPGTSDSDSDESSGGSGSENGTAVDVSGNDLPANGGPGREKGEEEEIPPTDDPARESGDNPSGIRSRFAEDEFDLDTEYGFAGEDADEDFQSGVFINSLDELEEDDIPLSGTAREAERVSPFEYVRRVMFWLFLAAFLVSAFLLVRNLIQKQQATRIYRDIQEEFFSAGFSFDVSEAFRTDRSRTPGLEEDPAQRSIHTMTELLNGAENDLGEEEDQVEVRVVNEDLERMRAALQNLMRRNSDVYAYITVQNTNISYPVVRGKDNDFYLNHAVTGEYNPVGCVFADYRCDRSITKNFNTVFYGHNITTGGSDMFHDVEKFFDGKLFNNSYVYVYTMDGIYIYEPFAVYEAAYDDDYFKVEFTSPEEFTAFAEDCQKLSTAKDSETLTVLSKNFVFTDKDRVLTLSTCTNGYYTQRYALHAKLVATILD